MIWLARKAFFGKRAVRLHACRHRQEVPEMYAFRDRYAKEWGLDLKIEPCPPIDAVDPTLPPAARSAARKTEGLKMALAKHGFDGLIAGIRRDEEATRAKERVFSPRGAEGEWDVRDQPPEFWDQFNASVPHGAHLRIHPILHWTEDDIWAYTKRENIPIIPLYLSNNGKRYRSLGDQDITLPVASLASNIDEILVELAAPRCPSAPAAPSTTNPKTPSNGFASLAICDLIHEGVAMNVQLSRRETAAVESPRRSRHLHRARRPQVRIVIVGHVDHGKSTLVGRLLHETGSLPDGKLEMLKAVSARRGMPFEWSFLLDALQTERDQGITIDTTQIRFRTPSREVVLIDAPGHAEFLRNMITGASQADAALLIIDAAEGVRDQTRRHGYLLHLLGVRQVAIVINKMDRVDFSEARFNAISTKSPIISPASASRRPR